MRNPPNTIRNCLGPYIRLLWGLGLPVHSGPGIRARHAVAATIATTSSSPSSSEAKPAAVATATGTTKAKAAATTTTTTRTIITIGCAGGMTTFGHTSMCVYIHKYIHKYIYIYMCIYIYIYIYVCIYIYIYIYSYIYIYIYLCIHLFTYLLCESLARTSCDGQAPRATLSKGTWQEMNWLLIGLGL